MGGATMNARVFLHPRLIKDKVAMDLFAATLAEWGYDTAALTVYDVPSVRRSHQHELVRDLGHVEFTGAYDDPTPETGHVYQRMDGERFVRHDPEPARRA